MYCNKCGKEILENSIYCPFCGFKLKTEDADINVNIIKTFYKSRSKELFIFGMWFLFNSLLFLLIGSKRRTSPDGYGVNIYQICTFIAPLFYWGFREALKYLLCRKDLTSSKKMLLRVLSFLLGSIPVFFIFVPFTLIIGGFFQMDSNDRVLLNLILTIVAVEFFYRDLFKKKYYNDVA